MSKIIADYNDFDYETNFWKSQNREYEDQCDRIALRKLLPNSGNSIIDVCAGFGRLVDEYKHKFREIYLFDYAMNLLSQAKRKYGDSIHIQQGSIDNIDFHDEQFEVTIMIRASHHLQDFSAALNELKRITKRRGIVIVEIANKRNLLEMIRYFLGKSEMRPFELAPSSRNKKGFYNYNPIYVENLFKQNGFKILQVRGVSFFRQRTIKKMLHLKLLTFLETVFQPMMGYLKLTPSLYYKLEKMEETRAS